MGQAMQAIAERLFKHSSLAKLAADQILSSLTLFVFSIVLIREHGANEYAVFAAALSASLAVTAIVNAGYIEPLAVKGKISPSRLSIVWRVLGLSLFATAFSAAAVPAIEPASALMFTFGFSTLFVSRRLISLSGKTGLLLAVSASSLLSISVAAYVLTGLSQSVNIWLATYGALGALYVCTLPSTQKDDTCRVEINWPSLATAMLFWLCTNFYFYYLPATDRSAESGELRLLYTLFMPAMQLATILGTSILSRSATMKTLSAVRVTALVSCVYGFVITLSSPELIFIVTGVTFDKQVMLIATAMVLAMNISGLSSIIARMRDDVRSVLIGSVAAAFAIVGTAFATFNLATVLVTITVGYLVSAACMYSKVFSSRKA